MTTPFAFRFSAAPARSWAESLVECLHRLPEGDARRGRMRERVDVALRSRQLFCIDYAEGCSVMAPTSYARGLLIEARGWT